MDLAELKAEYRRLSRSMHPDRNRAPNAAELFAELAIEYETKQRIIKRSAKQQEAAGILISVFGVAFLTFVAEPDSDSAALPAALATIAGGLGFIIYEQDNSERQAAEDKESAVPQGLSYTPNVDESAVQAIMKAMPMDWSEGNAARRERAVSMVLEEMAMRRSDEEAEVEGK